MAALSIAFMLLSYFPYLTYAIPGIAGLFIMVALIETDWKWALLSYLSSAILVFLSAETESRLLYIFFLGYYPILKALIEKLKKPIFEWFIKLMSFNLAVLLVYIIFARLFGISLEDFGAFGRYGAFVLLGLGNIVFVFYDIAVSRMAGFYLAFIRPKLKNILK